MEVVVAKTRKQIAACKDAVLSFRPDLNELNYLDLLVNIFAEESFKLVYIPDDENIGAAAFIGYRTMYLLRTGWVIYIDGLYTDPQYQGRGYAGSLMDFATQEALDAGIQSIHFDGESAGNESESLYLNKGYVLAGSHFSKQICL